MDFLFRKSTYKCNNSLFLSVRLKTIHTKKCIWKVAKISDAGIINKTVITKRKKPQDIIAHKETPYIFCKNVKQKHLLMHAGKKKCLSQCAIFFHGSSIHICLTHTHTNTHWPLWFCFFQQSQLITAYCCRQLQTTTNLEFHYSKLFHMCIQARVATSKEAALQIGTRP